MGEVSLQVLIQPTTTAVVEDAICFETGLTRKQAADPELYAYEHHGPQFSAIDPGSLSMFFEDVILGRPLPPKFITRSINIDTLFALALFIHRDLATHPAMPGIVASVDLAHRRGFQGFGHIEPELCKFLLILGSMFPKDLSQSQQGQAMRTAVAWVYEFITEGSVPSTAMDLPKVQVLDVGSNGFVLGETEGPLLLGWIALFRQGYLKGVLLGPQNGDRRRVLAARKSVFVDFSLTKAASILNETESSVGLGAGWESDELWLRGPEGGTIIPLSGMMEVFLRV